MVKSGNIFAGVQANLSGEETDVLAAHPGAVVERIVSTGQASPPGFWYDQDWTEWVLVLAGEAGLGIEGEAVPRTLRPGDHLELPAHLRHRLEWTRADPPTVWLAVHWKGGEKPPPKRASSDRRSISIASGAKRAGGQSDHGHKGGERREFDKIAHREISKFTHQDLLGSQ